jgi:WD40 repeat protein
MNKQPLLIQDAYDFGPPPPKSRETLWEKLYRFFFGDDVFISYSRADAIRYVPSLAARLAAKKHICFFDQLVADPSEDLPEKLKKKILRSTVFVLVGTKGAMASSFVRKEIELFRHTRRPFIPVDVDGALIEQEGWRDVVGVAKIREDSTRVHDGDPSPEVVNLIKDSFRYTRRSQWLRASLLAGVSVIFITAAVSLLVIRAAQAEAAGIKRQAASEVTAAKKEVAEARQNAQNFRAEADRAKADADDARNRAENAATAAEVATTQREAAEHAMRQAQELERRSAERAAETARREAGSRAALLSREPGREVDALALAVEAAEQSIASRGDFPDEVMDGIAASASAADYSLPLEDAWLGEIIAPLISPNGEKIVGTIRDLRTESTTFVLWNGRTGKSITSVITVAGTIPSPSFSRDGKRLAALNLDRKWQQRTLFLWDLTGTQARPVETLCGASPYSSHIALDNDGSHIIISERQNQDSRVERITLCEIATGRKEVLTDSATVYELAFTPEDEPAMYGLMPEPGAAELRPAVYFLRSGRKVKPKHPDYVPKFVGFGDDGSIIIIARGGEAPWAERVYIQSLGGDLRRLGGYQGEVQSVAMVDGQVRVVTVSGRRVRVADARNSPNFAALRAHVLRLDMSAFSPDSRTVLTVGTDGKGQLWDVQTGRLRHTLPITDELLKLDPWRDFRRQMLAAFRADGKRVVTANDRGEIQIWDVETGRPVCPVPWRGTAVEDFPLGVSFLAGGDYVLAVYSKGTLLFSSTAFISFLDARTCRLAGTFNFDEQIRSVSFSQDGMAIITGVPAQGYTWDGSEMKLWSLRGVDLRAAAPIRLSSSGIKRPAGPFRAFLLDGARMLTVTEDDTGQLWVSGSSSPVRLEGRRGDKRGTVRVVLSADGTRVAAVSWREARVWDTRSGKLLVAFECELEMTLGNPVSLSSDGSKLLVTGRDHTVRIYPTSREDFLGVARRLLGK